jgi:hypothetical protein
MRALGPDDIRRLVDQVEEMAEGRVKRNARILQLETALREIEAVALRSPWGSEEETLIALAATASAALVAA